MVVVGPELTFYTDSINGSFAPCFGRSACSHVFLKAAVLQASIGRPQIVITCRLIPSQAQRSLRRLSGTLRWNLKLKAS
jgi:hypothetical protein